MQIVRNYKNNVMLKNNVLIIFKIENYLYNKSMII
jgi:hypothetical protein